MRLTTNNDLHFANRRSKLIDVRSERLDVHNFFHKKKKSKTKKHRNSFITKINQFGSDLFLKIHVQVQTKITAK
jgi:hypothetical protein